MATKKTFDFPLGATVDQKKSHRLGEIIGRAQYARANPSYLVEHVDGDGDLVSRWFDEEALTIVSATISGKGDGGEAVGD